MKSGHSELQESSESKHLETYEKSTKHVSATDPEIFDMIRDDDHAFIGKGEKSHTWVNTCFTT